MLLDNYYWCIHVQAAFTVNVAAFKAGVDSMSFAEQMDMTIIIVL